MGRRLPAVLLVVAVALAVTGASVAVIRLKSDPRRAVVEAEPVKAGETTSHADLMSASGLGSLIQATVGSFGGVGGR
jgi:hypothetical protein